MKTFKKFLIIFVLFVIYIFISIFSYSNTVSANISDSVFRLHVIANSNSEKDQNLKYLVRDALIKYMNSICENISSKEDAIKIANENKDKFYMIAKNVIQEYGFDYNVNIDIGNFSFPTKSYGDISLPSGFYDALKVEIGSASGQNWWCVTFPSLCFVDISSGIVDEEAKENLEDNLQEETYSIISETKKPNIKFKFKLIEFFANNPFEMAKT